MNENLKMIVSRYQTAYLISTVLLKEVAELSASIKGSDYETELGRLNTLIAELKAELKTTN